MKPFNRFRASYDLLENSVSTSVFVTLVMLDDGYIPGALLMGYSLRRMYPETVLICMVTREISPIAREILSLFFNHVIEVEKIYLPCRGMKRAKYLPYVFTKLNALLLCSEGLLSYTPEKVIFIDADVLPLRNYHDLCVLDPPAGIINEYKSNLIKTDNSGKYRVSESGRLDGRWHWHKIYDPVCPHGELIPAYITDRVRDNPGNMGVHGALMIMKPSPDEYERIMKDINRPETINRIKTYRWPEMQYLTLRWSGQWRNIDIRYCGFKGYPSIDLLYGTHFAGPKPWRLSACKRSLYNLPDYRVWHDMYLRMYTEFKKELGDCIKAKKLATAINRRRVGHLHQSKRVVSTSDAYGLHHF